MKRRIFAFVTMVVTLVLSVLFLAQPIKNMVNLSNDFGQGITLVYDITKRADVTSDDSSSSQTAKDLTDIDIDNMVMERLNAAGVRGAEVTLMNPDDPSYSSDYPQIDSEGNTDGDNYQRLRVTLTQTSSSELENIKLLISSTGTLTVTDAENHYHTGTDFFASSTPAEVKYDEGKPYVLLHVKDKSTWDGFVKEAEGVKDSSLQKQMFIWRNYIAGTDTYAKAYPSDKDVASDRVVKSKILFRDSTDSAFSTDDTSIKMTSYKDADNTSHEWTISSAKAYVAAINAEDYGFDISLAYSDTSVSPRLGENALLYTIIGFVVAYVVIFVVMICVYGWSGVVSFISNSTSLALNVLVFSALGFEFSPAAVIGLVLSTLLGVIININYFQRVKDELSKGRDLVKANKEGYHKSYLLTVDICAGTFLAAISTFFLTKDMTQVATGVITIGSVLAFLITNYFTKWMLYWLTTGLVENPKKNYGIFGYKTKNNNTPVYVVDSESALPKREENAPTKKEMKRTMVGTIVLSSLALLGVVGLGVMGGIKGGDEMFARAGNYKSEYRIDIMTTATGYLGDNQQGKIDFTTNTGENVVKYLHSERAFGNVAKTYLEQKDIAIDENYVDTYLDTVGLEFSLENGEFQIVTLQNDAQVLAGKGEFSVVYASFVLDKEPSDSSSLTALKQAMDTLTTNSTVTTSDSQTNMTAAKGFANTTLKNKYSKGYRLTAGVSKSSAVAYYESWFFAGLALGVFILALYVFIRFGLCAFICELSFSVASVVFVLALMSVCGIAFSAFTAFGVAVGSMILGIFNIFFFEKNSEYLRSLKLKKTKDINQRFVIGSLSVKANQAISLGVIVIVLSFSVFGMALMGTSCLPMFVGMVLVSLIGIGLSYFFTPYLYLFLRTHIHFTGAEEKIQNQKKKKASKPKKIIEADPDEAKETIVPGVNDYKNW